MDGRTDRIFIWRYRSHNVKHPLSTLPSLRKKLVEIGKKSGVEAGLWFRRKQKKMRPSEVQ